MLDMCCGVLRLTLILGIQMGITTDLECIV